MLKTIMDNMVAIFWWPPIIPHLVEGGAGKEPGNYDDEDNS